jgi:hypothetical protein
MNEYDFFTTIFPGAFSAIATFNGFVLRLNLKNNAAELTTLFTSMCWGKFDLREALLCAMLPIASSLCAGGGAGGNLRTHKLCGLC